MLCRGETAEGRYRILRQVGGGGSGSTYLARDLQEERSVVLKLVSDRELGIREGELLERLHHRGIPQLYDSFPMEGGFCLAMEYREGQTLDHLVREGGPFSLTEGLRTAEELCSILEYAHSLSPPVIHRDLKPSNILKDREGRIVLLDFGSALGNCDGDREEKVQMGTPGYAAPEQFGSTEEISPRTDVYGVCAVLHFLLTGKSPLETGLRPAGEFVPALRGSFLEKLLSRCLSVSPAMRCSDCRELRLKLRNSGRIQDHRTGLGSAGRAAAAAAGCAVLFGCGFVVLRLLGGLSEAGRYGVYMARAEAAQTEESSLLWLEKAVLTDPSCALAYERMLLVMARDGRITREEKEFLRNCLYAAAGAGRNGGTCEDRFRSGNRDAYDRFLLRLALELYAGCEGGGCEADRILAGIEKSRHLTGAEQELARSMRVLTGTETGGAADIEAWQVLVRAAADFAKREDTAHLAAALCGGVAGRILCAAAAHGNLGEDGARAREIIREAEINLEQAKTMRDRIPGDLLEEAQQAVTEAGRALSGEAHRR